MKKIAVAVLVGLALGSIGVANAAAGDSTVSIGYAQIHSKGLKDMVNYYGGAISNIDASDVGDAITAGGLTANDLKVSGHTDKYKDPKGLNLKYRYEIDDNWGVIGSFTYAWDDYNAHANASANISGISAGASLKGKLKAKYFSINVGPTYRFNEYVSAYVMGGVAHSKYDANGSLDSYANGKSIHIGSLSESKDKTAFSYGAGLQFNPYKNIAIDVAYEGSGSGDWKTSGFNVGVGYSF
ncbi:Ail/Lom family outer membrane beta-barrel protein [Salmonella enterica]|nr:Ail/Lom family outer membrane beta-barrel protein [Salmonella enterica]EMD2961478.1 Ail/Lom family outer membrane beta-barrel protein [Salmonella enterica]